MHDCIKPYIKKIEEYSKFTDSLINKFALKPGWLQLLFKK